MNNEIKPPLWILLELTHKCPLECAYCYNQLDFANTKDVMSKEDWFRVMEQAREMGAVQLGISGGEPLLNKDVVEIVRKANDLKFYTNLITSGVGAPKGVIAKLKEAGLKTVQLGIQSHDRNTMTLITNNKSAYDEKIAFAKEIKESISIPVIAVGLITTASEGEFLLENSYCDFVAYGREFLRNPNFVFTAASELNNKDVINSSYQRAF